MTDSEGEVDHACLISHPKNRQDRAFLVVEQERSGVPVDE